MKWARAQAGISLVELMVAITLSLILGAAVVQIFISSKNVNRVQEAVSYLQESGRFAIERISRDLRMAGYVGCARSDAIQYSNRVIGNNGTDVNLAPSSGAVVEGVRGENNVVAGNAHQAVAGTDVLTIRKASASGMRLASAMASATDSLSIEENSAGAVAGDILMVGDCIEADLFRVTSIGAVAPITLGHDTTMNSSDRLRKAYDHSAEVMVFEPVTYFVAENNGRRSLYVRERRAGLGLAANQTPPRVELVEGVENMQLEFGIDDGTGKVGGYVGAGAVTDWTEVLSVKVDLLLRSVEANVVPTAGDQAQQIDFNGAAIAADGHLRQQFSTVVAVRGRLE